MIVACILYTLRVLAAWWVIAQIKKWIGAGNPKWPAWVVFYVSVFIGAELTFVVDYFIFDGLVFNG
jgi:hypothetical protein